MIITEILAVLSISAAVGLRLALPLLLIGLLSGETLWQNVPFLSHIPPTIVICVLVSWSLFELIISKDRPRRRFLHSLELMFSPIVGAIAGIAIGRSVNLEGGLMGVVGLIGGLLAFVIQLVQVGWLYRIQYPPLWILFLQDFLCVCLVLFAFDAPQQGGLIALLLLWLAIRMSTAWRRWYLKQAKSADRRNPRRYKQEPD